MGSCINTENSIHKTDIGFEDLSVWKERQRLPYRDGEHAYRRRVIHPLLLLSNAAEETFGRQASVSVRLLVQGQHHLDGDCRLEGRNPYRNFLAFDCHCAGEELARSHRSLPPLSPARACIGEVPSSASCIGRPSSALHVRLLRLKLSHKKRDDIDADKFFLSR